MQGSIFVTSLLHFREYMSMFLFRMLCIVLDWKQNINNINYFYYRYETDTNWKFNWYLRIKHFKLSVHFNHRWKYILEVREPNLSVPKSAYYISIIMVHINAKLVADNVLSNWIFSCIKIRCHIATETESTLQMYFPNWIESSDLIHVLVNSFKTISELFLKIMKTFTSWG